MNVKAISVNVGKALLVSALFMFLSIVVSLVNGQDSAFSPLLISFIITLIFGSFPFIFVKGQQQILSLNDGFLTIVLSWLLSFIFGMLPYVLWGGEFTLANAWFESVSGYTTTGSTILNDIEALPKSLLFWRAFTHWIGGMGILMFVLAFLPQKDMQSMHIMRAEVPGPSVGKLVSKTMVTARILYIIYTVLTLLETALLLLSDMPLFDSITTSFATA